jgi:hypothetical protein
MWLDEIQTGMDAGECMGAFTVQVTERGFTVDGSYYREGGVRHDGYFLALDGVYRGF